MIFFGTLCLGAMAYGVLSLFGGITLPLHPPRIEKVTDSVMKAIDKSREEANYSPADGVLMDHLKFRFEETLGMALDYGFDMDFPVGVTFLLTPGENEALKKLILPLAYYETYADKLPERLRDEQRAALLMPILDFLDSIPPVRIQVDNG